MPLNMKGNPETSMVVPSRRFMPALFFVLLFPGVPAAASECVILLHGLARTASSMDKLESVFKEEGYVVANMDYPSRKAPIESLASPAIDAGLEACRVAGAETIHFVTHSMGGILVRYYLVRSEIPELGRVVMLAPPNQGSEVVDEFSGLPGYTALNGPAGHQLGTDADSIPNSLGPVTYPVGIIAGTLSVNPILSTALPNPDDGKVSLARTRVDGMADFIAVTASHPFIMRDADAIRQAVAFIRHGQFDHGYP